MGIINFSKTVKSKSYLAISLLGSSYKLNIKYVKSSSIDLVQNDSEFCLFLPAKYKNVDNMEIINSAIKKTEKVDLIILDEHLSSLNPSNCGNPLKLI